MKKITSLLLLGLLVLNGCAHHYVITLDNGDRIVTTSKPHRQGARFFFKDVAGQEAYVPVGRVREIEPASMAGNPNAAFQPQSGK